MYRKCLGPTRFYLEIKCKPIFRNEKDCCPEYWKCPIYGEDEKNRAKVCNHNDLIYNVKTSSAVDHVHPCEFCNCDENLEGANKP